MDDEEHTARPFCAELHQQMSKYFDFILNPAAEDFNPLYYVATYLAPVHKFVIGNSELSIVRKYLEGKCGSVDVAPLLIQLHVPGQLEGLVVGSIRDVEGLAEVLREGGEARDDHSHTG